MRKSWLFTLVSTQLLLCGCATSYHQYMTRDDRIVARYEQQVRGRWFKRTLCDIFSIGFAEIWYSRATTTYEGVMERRRIEAEMESAWQQWRKSKIGATRSQLVAELGLPDADEPDGSGGRVLTWEDSLRSGGVSIHGNSWVGVTGASWINSTKTERMWVNLGPDGKVAVVGRRTKHDADPRRTRDR